MTKGYVVVGVDVPATSGDAVIWAAETAVRHHRPLKLVHAADEVIGLPQGEVGADDTQTRDALRDNTQALSTLSQAVEEVRARFPDLELEPIEVVGDAVEALLAHQQDALLVVGTGHRNALSELILGSTSLGVAMHASSPVAVVPPGRDRTGEPHGVVVVAVDGSADSAVAARVACIEARASGATVVAVNTWGLEFVEGYVITESDPEQFAAIQERQRGLAERGLASARRDFPDVTIEVDVVHGRVVGTLLERSQRADLLVLGSRGLGGFSGKLLGSVSQRVLRGSSCPVVITKAAREH